MKASCNQLPSQREAFTEFVRLSQAEGQLVDDVKGVYSSVSEFYGAGADGKIYGYGVTPDPQSMSENKNSYFSSGKVAMLVSTAVGAETVYGKHEKSQQIRRGAHAGV